MLSNTRANNQSIDQTKKPKPIGYIQQQYQKTKWQNPDTINYILWLHINEILEQTQPERWKADQ